MAKAEDAKYFENNLKTVYVILQAPESAAQLVTDLSVWKVHRPGVDNVLDAIRLQTRYQLSFWDAMILASAQALNCQNLWSEDLNPGQSYDKVTVSNPFMNGDH